MADDPTAEPGRSYWYRLLGTTGTGAEQVFGPVQGTARAPREFALSSAWPNPTRGPLTLQFTMARSARVELSVIDVAGREVSVLTHGDYAPGRYQVSWDGRAERGPVPAGLYFVRFATPGRAFVSRVVVTR